MSYVIVERVVARHPDVVWSHLTDVATMPKWIEGFVALERFDDAAIGAGTRLGIALDVAGARELVTCEVTAWSPPRLLAIESRQKRRLHFDRAVLEPRGNGTLVRFESEVHEKGIFAELLTRKQGLLGEPLELPIARTYERCIESFRKLVEAQTLVAYR
jgi:uncharacterized protein YndB with AHSA1/START domain